jgi:iron-sulfur cluster assembly protein
MVLTQNSDSHADLVRNGNERLVRLTQSAGSKVHKLIDREKTGHFLRIRITGGGCNGLSYNMKFVPSGKKGDILVESAGVRVLVDSKTALYLRGTTLEFSDKLVGGGFKFQNPNAKASCSCGESFNL